MRSLKFALLLPFLLVTSLFAASTTQPAIYIRDCGKQADIGPPLSAAPTLYQSQLPASWTLDFTFGLAPGHTAKVTFVLDGKSTGPGFEQPPYCPNGHNTPIAAGLGSHTIVTTASGGVSTFTFTLAKSPPATQPSVTWGANYITGANSNDNNPAIHPTLASTQTALNQKWVRLWAEYPAMQQAGDNYWTVARAWRSRGFKVLLVQQMWNKQVNMASSLDWTKRVIAGKAVDAVNLANESNSQGYYTGSQPQLLAMVNQDAPLLHAAGIRVVSPSAVNNVNWMKQVAALGLYKPCDAVDFHAYGTGLTLVAQAKAVADGEGKTFEITECGTTAAATPAMLKQLSIPGAIVYPYSELPSGNPSFASNVLDVAYRPNTADGLYAGYLSVMGQ